MAVATAPVRFGDPGAAVDPSRTGATALAGWARLFSTRTGPRLIAAALAAALAARLWLGQWRWRDLLVAAVMVAAQPFTEWVTHVFVLHARPRRLGRLTVDLGVARKHRRHHLDPRDIELVLVPLPTVVTLIAGAGAAIALFGRNPQGVTAGVTGFALLLGYEWTHFLIHSPYRPRRSLYRSIWRAHRLHHFKNERYWFGITTNIGDRVLRTNPDRGEVETSPTARTLVA
ncbi:MAG TPA: sterol desaturase family protein [Acidimicrobiales bacterium]|nr:sterol desaturase family protein [Acidimicrobiales bacterium]